MAATATSVSTARQRGHAGNRPMRLQGCSRVGGDQRASVFPMGFDSPGLGRESVLPLCRRGPAPRDPTGLDAESQVGGGRLVSSAFLEKAWGPRAKCVVWWRQSASISGEVAAGGQSRSGAYRAVRKMWPLGLAALLALASISGLGVPPLPYYNALPSGASFSVSHMSLSSTDGRGEWRARTRASDCP